MAADPHSRIVTHGDRKLCLEVVGEPSGPAVLVCAGTPNSRLLYRPWVDDALARGIRLIGYDRPGYGGSDPQPGHSVADGAADVRAIASALELDRLAVWGFSGGGPYVLACAALLPDLVVAAATVGSVAPYGAPGLDYFSGMGEDNVEDTKLYFEDPAAARRKSQQEREELLDLTPGQIVDSWRTLVSPVDAAVLTGAYAEYVVASLKDGLTVSDQGWWDDGVALQSDWGFALNSIRVPVKIWHGRQDRFVPFQHGEWLSQAVPNADAELSDEQGHLTLLAGGVSVIHEWLVNHL